MTKKRKPLSPAAQSARKPPPPWMLLNAIQEPLGADDRIAELEAAVEAARRDLDEQWIKEEERERERQRRGSGND